MTTSGDEDRSFCPPRLFPFCTWLRTATLRSIRSDLLAGLPGAVIVLPQGVAFALIAGLPPEYGLYTAIVPVALAALFGSSHHLVSGPTTAISIVLFATVSTLAERSSPDFIAYALTITFLAGFFQMLLGLARLGALVNFVSHTVVVGFTAGAAILIITNQLHALLGIPAPQKHSFVHVLSAIAHAFPSVNLYAAGLAAGSFALAVIIRLISPRLPNLLLALTAVSAAGAMLDAGAYGVPLLGALPGHLPPLSMPEFSAVAIRKLTPGALAIAMLGLMEAVSIARAMALKSGQRIDNNQEFVGQGLANMVGSFFSSYASSGSFTRSGVNYDAGAKSPLAAVFAACFVAIIVLFVGPLTAYVPMPAVAGILVFVGLSLIDLRQAVHIARSSRTEAVVLSATFLATLFVELEFAIFVGVILSLLLYLNRTSRPQFITLAYDLAKRGFVNIRKKPLPECPQLKILRIDGSLFFGAVDNTVEAIDLIVRESPEQAHLLIVGGGINFIDLSGCMMLAHEARTLRLKGRELYLCSLKGEVLETLKQGGCLTRTAEQNIFLHKTEAIRKIVPRLDPERCRVCTVRCFQECAQMPGAPETGDLKKQRTHVS